jgi:hypothetical protein
MSEWELDQVGAHFELMPGLYLTIYDLAPGTKWAWQVAAIRHGEESLNVVILSESQEEYDSWQAAQEAGLEASATKLAKQIECKAAAELRRTKQAAQDADDVALVAAHGDVVWEMRDVGFATVHTATVAGHPCCVEVQPGGHVKWELEPEYYGHPYTWDAPDLETAKIRAAAAALREPCKRWLVTLPDVPHNKGGTVEVLAVTSEGALYRAARALGWRRMDLAVKGKAMEVRL